MKQSAPQALHFQYILALADDHFIVSHRLSLWCGHAPTPEDDLSLPNIALDILGHAEMLYQHASKLDDAGRDEDALAFGREEHEYRNMLLTERATQHCFAQTIIQLLYFSCYMKLFWQFAMTSKDETLANIATRAHKEVLYHVRYASKWAIILADGTAQSAAKIQQAVADLYPYTAEFFAPNIVTNALNESFTGIAVNPETLHEAWHQEIATLAQQAGMSLTLQDGNGGRRLGGRDGKHSEEMGYLLAELQFMQRQYPNLNW
ncbi:MAG: phenylacetate-CoA oxygenase subunit PaaC [Alphaproteobacteria bacterium]|nr:phenylacetate-CoA oxygenase subunit PaaC [Alphaproteobacteria bacterium]